MKRAIATAKDEGHIGRDADEEQMLFEIHGLILAPHYEARFLRNPASLERAWAGFENILSRYGAGDPQPARVPAKRAAARSTRNREQGTGNREQGA